MKLTNELIFQWLFFRVEKTTRNVVIDFELFGYDIIAGSVGSRGKGKISKKERYAVSFWVAPCTGWWNDMIFLNNKQRILKID